MRKASIFATNWYKEKEKSNVTLMIRSEGLDCHYIFFSFFLDNRVVIDIISYRKY